MPVSPISLYRRRRALYGGDEPAASLYLVIEGKVKVCRKSDNGRNVLIDIYQPDDFFGEAVFLGDGPRPESAVALEDTRVMCWTISEIETIAIRRPALSVALLQLLARRSWDFGARIATFAVESIPRRLAWSLLRFSEKLGQESEDGSVLMMPFTHELLSEYVGTSREIVTHHMNHFRRQGFLRYSREGIRLYREPIDTWLRHEGSAEHEPAAN